MSIHMYRWEHLDWETIERQVFKLQKRIYQASQRGDVKTVHNLERLLTKSWSAKCLAVRRVTQDNHGKKTAGVDGGKSLNPKQRMHLVNTLELEPKAQPVRRVWIPKPGTEEKRGLGIPVMYDRALQGLVKLALEPEWEAKFEKNSYGFRPGRSCHDAIEAIRTQIQYKPKYVLDADIAKCFDHIDHQALLNKLTTFPTLRRIIRAWLKAGMMEGLELHPTEEGTPQGGVASPLLANIALHGLESDVRAAFPVTKTIKGKQIRWWQPAIIRYADDFLILHQDITVIEEAKEVTSRWLAGMGLELKPSKTRITHTLHKYQGNVGFDFLSFHVRQYPVGKTHTGKCGGKGRPSTPLGFRTIIKPSKEAQKRHLLKIKAVIQKRKSASQAVLIKELNPRIQGWCNYHRMQNAKRAFSRADHLTYLKLMRWAKRRHPNKSGRWVAEKYWHISSGKWNFAVNEGWALIKRSSVPIQEHVKVQGKRSPFDGDWVYWATRMGKYPGLPKREAELLKRQKGKCAYCGLYFKDEEVVEVDHIIPKALGGKNERKNWQLLHQHCHDKKTAKDGSLTGRGTRNKGQTIEEPCEVKVSRTDLKTNQKGQPHG